MKKLILIGAIVSLLGVVIVIVMLVLLSGCSPAPADTSVLQKANQTMQTTIQQQGKQIEALTTQLNALTALKATVDSLKSQSGQYVTRDELPKAMANTAPPVNTTDVLNRLSSLEGKLITLNSRENILEGKVDNVLLTVDNGIKDRMKSYVTQSDWLTLQQIWQTLQASDANKETRLQAIERSLGLR